LLELTTLGPSDRRLISTEQLVEHERLVRWVVRRQRLGGLSFEDAVQAGRIGLWRALQGYDPTRGTRLSTYAVPAIARAVWRAVYEHQPPRPVGRDELPLSASQSFNGPDPLVDDLAARLDADQVSGELHRLVGTLPQRLRQVIVAHYGLRGLPPRSFAQIGQALGVTRQRVQQLHVEALLWLAQPARSLALRDLLDRGHRLDYQRVLARQRRWRRTRRGGRGESALSQAR
jgi:RNA polymerase sigma factor (sigma-70 family)